MNQAPLFAAAGEALIDLLQESDGRFVPALGGSVYNCARALSCLGTPSAYLNPLSHDVFGPRFAQQLAHDKVAHWGGESTRPTSLAIVSRDAAGTASYVFHRAHVADRDFDPQQWNERCAASPSLQWCYSGGLALSVADHERYGMWLREQKSRGLGIAIDANARPLVEPESHLYQQAIWRTLGMADVIKVSDDDLRFIRIHPESPLRAARTLLTKTGAKWVALTLGAAGAYLVSFERAWCARFEGEIAIVDSVGAGDCFFAGLLHQLAQSNYQDISADMSHALCYAVANASCSLTRAGCQPPSATEAASYLSKVLCEPCA